MSLTEWKKLLEKELKGRSADELRWKPFDDVFAEPVYESVPEALRQHVPGKAPYVRGAKANNGWLIAQDYLVAGDPVTINAMILGDLLCGVECINIYINEYSPSLVEKLLADVVPDYISINFFCRNLDIVRDVIHDYSLFCDVKADDKRSLRGGIFLTGTFDLSAATLQVKDSFPSLRSINVDSSKYANEGADLHQQVAFALAAGNEIVHTLTSNGSSVDDVAALMQFTFATGPLFMPEIAKIRAFRFLWSKVVSEYSPSHECTQAAYIHAITARWNKFSEDAHNNILRTSSEALCGAVAGVNSQTVLPYDVTFKEPDSFSHRIARNVQLLLKEESYIDKVLDPAGGSYYIEHLTDMMIRESWGLFLKIEDAGGYASDAARDIINDVVQASANERRAAIEEGKMVFVGYNKYLKK